MITREMIISDIISSYPQTIEVFRSFGLDCMECQIADYEEVEHGATGRVWLVGDCVYLE